VKGSFSYRDLGVMVPDEMCDLRVSGQAERDQASARETQADLQAEVEELRKRLQEEVAKAQRCVGERRDALEWGFAWLMGVVVGSRMEGMKESLSARVHEVERSEFSKMQELQMQIIEGDRYAFPGPRDMSSHVRLCREITNVADTVARERAVS
jgi:hypothetical protein